jgi:hypothetical protein
MERQLSSAQADAFKRGAIVVGATAETRLPQELRNWKGLEIHKFSMEIQARLTNQ